MFHVITREWNHFRMFVLPISADEICEKQLVLPIRAPVTFERLFPVRLYILLS